MEGEVGQLLQDVLGRKVDRDAIAGMYERTDGNPLYVRCLAREMGEEVEAPPRVSAGVLEVISRRLERLPVDCRDVLRVAVEAKLVKLEHVAVDGTKIEPVDDVKYSYVYRNVEYRFNSKKNYEAFKKDPEKYLPASQ